MGFFDLFKIKKNNENKTDETDTDLIFKEIVDTKMENAKALINMYEKPNITRIFKLNDMISKIEDSLYNVNDVNKKFNDFYDNVNGYIGFNHKPKYYPIENDIFTIITIEQNIFKKFKDLFEFIKNSDDIESDYDIVFVLNKNKTNIPDIIDCQKNQLTFKCGDNQNKFDADNEFDVKYMIYIFADDFVLKFIKNNENTKKINKKEILLETIKNTITFFNKLCEEMFKTDKYNNFLSYGLKQKQYMKLTEFEYTSEDDVSTKYNEWLYKNLLERIYVEDKIKSILEGSIEFSDFNINKGGKKGKSRKMKKSTRKLKQNKSKKSKRTSK